MVEQARGLVGFGPVWCGTFLVQALYLRSIAHGDVQRKKTGYSPSKT